MEWIDVNERKPQRTDIIKVRRLNGDEIKAYYHSDGLAWIPPWYDRKQISSFQDFTTNKFLFDVTHWKPYD